MSELLSNLTDGQLHRLVYSNWDFQQALSALTFLMEECDFQAQYNRVELRKFRCYEASLIISFARPFEPSRGQTTLGLRTIGVQLDPQERELKEAMLNLRRKIIAHSDEDHMHYRGSTHRPLEDSSINLPLFQYVESLHIEEAQCRPLEALLRKLTSRISKAIFELAQTAPSRLNLYKQPDPRAQRLNPSIEGASTIRLHLLAAADHVKR
jgi:hypothetical protein